MLNQRRDSDQQFVGPEHLLVGVLREAHGIGAAIFLEHGLTADAASNEVQRILNTRP
jgi:hypothetical protein